jgi:radical SAM-linked protein
LRAIAEERQYTILSIRRAVWFSVEGDPRFLSHHDMMRLMERAAARAGLPLKYTQGFNPHPRLSLPLPRPVGVASRAELAVMELDSDPAADWLETFARQMPPGLAVLRAQDTSQAALEPMAVEYELTLDPTQVAPARARLDELEQQEQWEVLRRGEDAGDGPSKHVNLKGRIERFALDGDRLSFSLPVEQGNSARPGEVLELLGLAAAGGDSSLPPCAEALCRLVRTAIRCRP